MSDTRFYVRIVHAGNNIVTQHDFGSYLSRALFLNHLPLCYRVVARWEEAQPQEMSA